jgi:hypothetical protein
MSLFFIARRSFSSGVNFANLQKIPTTNTTLLLNQPAMLRTGQTKVTFTTAYKYDLKKAKGVMKKKKSPLANNRHLKNGGGQDHSNMDFRTCIDQGELWSAFA